jgi:DNA replication protein DnaC
MLIHPTIENLKKLRLLGMAKALENQLDQPQVESMSFEERLGLIIDREICDRENRKLQTRLRNAALKQTASVEDIDYRASRGIDKKLIFTLSNCQWIKMHRNVLIIGATGTGKTYLACALAHKACLEGNSVYYSRLSRLLPDLGLARGDGSYNKKMKQLAKVEVLILDDWGLSPLTDEQRRDLLELLDDRHEKCSTIVTSQLPIKLWHEAIGDKTLADAIMDRLVHNAYRLELKGDDSMRKFRNENLNKRDK